MKRKFSCECSCEFCLITVEDEPLDKKGSEKILTIEIFEHRSGKTGKLYKKPKPKADIVLIGKERTKFIKQVKKLKED